MDFDYTEEQQLLKDSLEKFLAKNYSFEQRRAIIDSGEGMSPTAWEGFASMGLLGLPEMQISGNGSYAGLLRWYQDRTATTPQDAWLLSVPLLVYRLAMLAWAPWLAQAVVRWLRWGWQCFTAGESWRPLRRAAG